MQARPSLLEYVEARIDRTDSCWLWTGSYIVGYRGFRYGLISFEGHRWLAHRTVYELYTGKCVHSDMRLDHLCRVTLCVNPKHLEIATQRENIKRGKNNIVGERIRQRDRTLKYLLIPDEG